MDVKLHVYHPQRRLLLLEFHPSATASAATVPSNVLLFVGGMFDNFRVPSYPEDLAALFPRNVPGQNWAVMHVQLSSAGRTFGFMGLDRDVQEIGVAVEYIRTTITNSPSTPIVLMGHSTGCQDLMHYLRTRPSPPRPAVHGAILQAAVSDREAMLASIASSPTTQARYDEALRIIAATPADKHATTLLPLHVTTPIMGPVPLSVTRFLSLASPESPANPGTDDYFSSDLGEETIQATFGALVSSPSLVGKVKEVLVLQGACDETVAEGVDKELLLERWRGAAERGGQGGRLSRHSALIPDARHDIGGEGVEERTARLVVMRKAVLEYLQDVVGGVDGGSGWDVWRTDKEAVERQRGEDLAKEFKETKL